MKKRILSLVLVALLMFSCMSTFVMAESEYYDVPDIYGMYEAAAITGMVTSGFEAGENAPFSFIINYLIYFDAMGECNSENTDGEYTWDCWKFDYNSFIEIIEANFANFSEVDVKAQLIESGMYNAQTDIVTIDRFGGFGGGFYYYAEDDLCLDNGAWEVSGMVLDYEINYGENVEEAIAGKRFGYDYVIGYDYEGNERYEIVSNRTKLIIATEDGVAKVNGFIDIDYHIYNGVLYQMTEEQPEPMRKIFIFSNDGINVNINTTATAVPLYNETAEIWFPMSEIEFTVELEEGFTLREVGVYCGWDELDVKPDKNGVYTVPAGDDCLIIDAYADRILVDTSEKFEDVKDTWYKEYVDYAVTYEMFNGVSDSEFAPNESMTRGMFVTVLSRLSGEDVVNGDFEAVFNDVADGKYYSDAIAWAAANEIVNGISDTEFGVNENITREQMCTMLVRFAEYMWIELYEDVEKTKFADDSKISNWAYESVYACQKAGIINGINETEFDPKGTATRAQVSKIFSIFHKDYLNW